MKYFKDARLYTKQLVLFDNEIEFQVSSNQNWIVDCVNSKVVGLNLAIKRFLDIL